MENLYSGLKFMLGAIAAFPIGTVEHELVYCFEYRFAFRYLS